MVRNRQEYLYLGDGPKKKFYFPRQTNPMASNRCLRSAGMLSLLRALYPDPLPKLERAFDMKFRHETMTLARFETSLAPQSLLPMLFRADPKQIRWHPTAASVQRTSCLRFVALAIHPRSELERAFEMKFEARDSDLRGL